MQVTAPEYVLSTARFSRSYQLSLWTLRTLCCENGNLRSRLEAVDMEYYSLHENVLPEFRSIRSNHAALLALATSKEPRGEHEGRISATLSTAHHTVLKKIARYAWDVHHEFSDYMKGMCE